MLKFFLMRNPVSVKTSKNVKYFPCGEKMWLNIFTTYIWNLLKIYSKQRTKQKMSSVEKFMILFFMRSITMLNFMVQNILLDHELVV